MEARALHIHNGCSSHTRPFAAPPTLGPAGRLPTCWPATCVYMRARPPLGLQILLRMRALQVLRRGQDVAKRDWTLVKAAIVDLRNDVYIARLFFGVWAQPLLWGLLLLLGPPEAGFSPACLQQHAPARAPRSSPNNARPLLYMPPPQATRAPRRCSGTAIAAPLMPRTSASRCVWGMGRGGGGCPSDSPLAPASAAVQWQALRHCKWMWVGGSSRSYAAPLRCAAVQWLCSPTHSLGPADAPPTPHALPLHSLTPPHHHYTHTGPGAPVHKALRLGVERAAAAQDARICCHAVHQPDRRQAGGCGGGGGAAGWQHARRAWWRLSGHG